ncbi:MAG TPA: hypothetical protein ENH43_01455 [Phycisphaerales bacterium]|nr:hypothetical protein [Phycisphaerales bacterium]
MKKIVLAIAVLVLAAPAWAGVTITATDEGGGVVAISYASDANVSAFGLDITVSDGNIIAISDYFVGESNGVAQGYGIFPGGIVIVGGSVTDYNTPVADAAAKGALGGLGTSGITIEIGALYEDGNQPALSGILCRVTVDTACTLSVTGNATRGNVVLESATAATLDLTGATGVPVVFECYTGPDIAEWRAVGSPPGWCASVNPRQCHGDADGLSETKGNYWVYVQDLNILLAAWGQPLSGLTGNEINADFDHLSETKGNYRVYVQDLNILLANWGTSAVDPNCP